MPAAAVIPAPIAYIKVVAVKKLVVGFLVREKRAPSDYSNPCHPSVNRGGRQKPVRSSDILP